MTAITVMGSNNAKVVADFHYLPDSDLLDHITWSNHQTHYFVYNASGRLAESQVREACFDYDAEGNILSSFITYTDSVGQDESVQMTYDSGKHPFSGLAYYFTGESYVNNQLTRTSF